MSRRARGGMLCFQGFCRTLNSPREASKPCLPSKPLHTTAHVQSRMRLAANNSAELADPTFVCQIDDIDRGMLSLFDFLTTTSPFAARARRPNEDQIFVRTRFNHFQSLSGHRSAPMWPARSCLSRSGKETNWRRSNRPGETSSHAIQARRHNVPLTTP